MKSTYHIALVPLRQGFGRHSAAQLPVPGGLPPEARRAKDGGPDWKMFEPLYGHHGGLECGVGGVTYGKHAGTNNLALVSFSALRSNADVVGHD